jgi:hypothetical protein
MPTHEENPLGSHGPKPEEIDASLGYERSDAGVTSIVVFLVSLFVFVGVCGVLTIGMGHLINAWMNRDDAAMNQAEGRTNKWTPKANIRDLGNLPNNPDMQKKVAELTQTFPTPRVQTDDGNQDVADLHRRENLLLDNYSRVDGSDGRVRIPIERAMELIAQRGLPVAPAPAQQSELMTGDSKPVVAVPLTSGFAPTAYEQEQAAEREAQERQKQ